MTRYFNPDEPIAYAIGDFPGLTKRDVFHLVALHGVLSSFPRVVLPCEVAALTEAVHAVAESQLQRMADSALESVVDDLHPHRAPSPLR